MSLRSDNVTKGAERAPNRSLFYAMGYTKEVKKENERLRRELESFNSRSSRDTRGSRE